MDQGAPARTLSPSRPAVLPGDQAGNGASADGGLAARVAAVELARTRLGEDLEHLSAEVRGQMGMAMQRTMWKVSAAGAAVLAGLIARKVVKVGWRAATHADPPGSVDSPSSSTWTEAMGWALATGVAMGVARVVVTRGAAMGWEKATGSPPPT